MKYSTEKRRQKESDPSQAEEGALNDLVDDFNKRVKKRINANKESGKSGWDDPYYNTEILKMQIRQNLEEGDMIDVAALAAFIWNKQE